MSYDAVAAEYDAHFHRPVDGWEDERLADLLRPYVDGQTVLDLGCGTGWVLDHLKPARYVGVDASPGMLEVLHGKHGDDVATAVRNVGRPGWLDGLPLLAEVDTVTATWAAQYFGNLANVLDDLRGVLRPGAVIILHGTTPRYRRRRHYVLNGANACQGFTEEAVRLACEGAGVSFIDAQGAGALPDRLAHWRRLWRAALRVQPTRHYSFAAFIETI